MVTWSTTVSEARSIVTNSVIQNTAAGGFSDIRLDHAIYSACSDFCMRVNPDRVVDSSLTVTSSSHLVNYSSVTDFSKERMLYGELEIDEGQYLFLQTIDWSSINHMIFSNHSIRTYPNLVIPTQGNAGNGYISFDSNRTDLAVWPRVSANTTLRLHYWKPCVRWTFGGDPATVINIPDEMIMGVLYFGVPQFFDLSEIRNTHLSLAFSKYEQHIETCKARTRQSGGGMFDLGPGLSSYHYGG